MFVNNLSNGWSEREGNKRPRKQNLYGDTIKDKSSIRLIVLIEAKPLSYAMDMGVQEFTP